MVRITEQASKYRHLENKSIDELVSLINQEDETVAPAIKKALPQISKLIGAIVAQLKNGGRLFYIGAGSGGRLAVLDIIELPTTYGIPKGMVNIILAGGVDRLADAREEIEDDKEEGWKRLQENKVNTQDIVVGVSASGTTPFVLSALKECRKNNIKVGCIVSNLDSPIRKEADFPVEVITGQEFVTGSTRMKCGTAQKMIFDMISTSTMIRLDRIEDNSMVHVKLINKKIIDRSVIMLMEKSGLTDYNSAKEVLLKQGSVKKAMDFLKQKHY